MPALALAHSRRLAALLPALLVIVLCSPIAHAGGPKYVAGTSFFNPAALGQPIHWNAGQVNYYVDRGPLNGSVSNLQATAMVDAAAALWSAIPTSAVTLTDRGPLNEDVSGSNIAATSGLITAPADVTSAATSYPLGVIYDADGSVIDAIFGTGASQPTSCQNNGVWMWLDNINPDATIAHGIILLNGLCASSPAQLQMMSFELERAFGRMLNLDFAQVNPAALTDELAAGVAGWPVMQPLSGACGSNGGECIPDPSVLRFDDIAALNRIYPVTAQNLANFPGKQLTAANTVSIQGTVAFRTGVGMQGVNVVARPLDANGNPLYQYTVTFVSGGYFNGNHGNAISGFADANGNPLARWGSNDPAQQGYFDLSDMPLPPGVTTANYQVTFEPINPLYILGDSVGPYLDGQVAPSGTLAPISVPGLAAGATQTLTVSAPGSAVGGYDDAIGSEASPRQMPPSGMWAGRIGQVGQTDWFTFPVRANRTFTVVTQALDETGAPTESKAMPAIGIWDAFDPVGSAALGSAPGMNGLATGETWVRVTSYGDDVVRLGVADQRGDGRPDYPYNGWVLYADSVQPLRLPAGGGPIVIHGMGFRLTDTVLVGGQPALVTSISPNEIDAIAPPAAAGVTGSVDVEVDDLPAFYAAAIVSAGISYNSGNGDALTLITAPMNTVPTGVPMPFTVTALGADLTPAGGVTVIYTLLSGNARLACGEPLCSVAATGDGRATMNLTAVDSTWSIVTASLVNGSSLQAQFAGGTPPLLAALTPRLSVAAGATVNWTVQALALKNGAPASGQAVGWQSTQAGIAAQSSSLDITDAAGIATQSLTVGPLAEGQLVSIDACLNGTSQCVAFSAVGARPEYGFLQAVSGATQTLSVAETPAQITLRLLDMDGNPMAAGSVSLYQALYAWAPPCGSHSACPPSNLLATQTATATSALDGTVTFPPAALPGVPTNLVALAASGNTSTLSITVERHP
ncbi:MAG: Ig-like domain-containing protein [Terracidiphilus sp.]|nr:Ig-like domain-containing protein [Terracidiphilus sp.]